VEEPEFVTSSIVLKMGGWAATGLKGIKRACRPKAAALILTALLAPLVATFPAFAASKAPPRLRVTAVYNGPYFSGSSPPDAIDAVSPTEIFELVNGEYRVIKRGGHILGSGTLGTLVGTQDTFLSDQSVLWDPSTDRFYFSIFENRGSSTPDEGIAWGFSKTANPHSAVDFCTYFNGFNYGSTSFPDRQSLGDSAEFLLIGSDRFGTTGGEPYLGSDLAWISKPPSGTSCPAPASFESGVQSLANADGSAPYSPVPSRQVDSSSTGWVVATPYDGANTYISLFSVTPNATTGSAEISGPMSLTVASYNLPPTAPQPGTTTDGQPAPDLQTRVYFSGAYTAYDPRLGHDDIWTSDTIAGGAGAEVRWYEIDPTAPHVDQYGDISDTDLYVYNSSIAPDRLVNGSVAKFGSDAVINVNTSSSTAFTAIQTTSTVDGGPTGPLTVVKQSLGPNIDFSCFEPNQGYCRWGDISGASPDPGGSPSAKEGRVWASNQWNLPATDDETPVWRTITYQVKP
jgi:hypothetical protein